MHKGHMTGCVIAIGLALVLFATTSGSIGGLGLLLAVLICPITMGAVMWFLMGSQRNAATGHSPGTNSEPQAPHAPPSAPHCSKNRKGGVSGNGVAGRGESGGQRKI